MFGDGFELFTGLARDGGICDEIDETHVYSGVSIYWQR